MTQTKTTHTETPWTTGIIEDGFGREVYMWIGPGPDHETAAASVGLITTKGRKRERAAANAAFIVEAVNSYESLREQRAALVAALDTLWLHAHWGHATASTDSRETCTMQDCRDAHAALALAKGE